MAKYIKSQQMNDKDFQRLLQKQLAEHRQDEGITTIRALEKRKKPQHTPQNNKPRK